MKYRLTSQQQTALAGLFNLLVGLFVLCGLIWVLATQGCSAHEVGDETVNPAPSSSWTLVQAQRFAQDAWAPSGSEGRGWSTPTPTSSMVPFLDSHSVLLLESVKGWVRLHDILVINEGPGRENVCHRVTGLKDGFALMDGYNNSRQDGWYPLSRVKWRVAGIIFTKGQ